MQSDGEEGLTKVTNATKGRAIPKGEVLPPAKDKQALTATAKQLDTDIRRECALVQRSITKLAEMLAQMRERELWKYLRDPLHKGAYKRFEEYAKAALGPLSRTRVYSLLAIRELEPGAEPDPAGDDREAREGERVGAPLARAAHAGRDQVRGRRHGAPGQAEGAGEAKHGTPTRGAQGSAHLACAQLAPSTDPDDRRD